MNKRKVSFMLITMFVTSSIFSGCFVPYSTQYNREVATALNYARAEVSQDSDSLYAYLNTTITRESSEEGENPDDTEQVEGTIPPSDDSSGDGSESGEGEDSEGPSVDEGVQVNLHQTMKLQYRQQLKEIQHRQLVVMEILLKHHQKVEEINNLQSQQ